MNFVGLERPVRVLGGDRELVVEVGGDGVRDVGFVLVEEAVEVYRCEVGAAIFEAVACVVAGFSDGWEC